jgi:hypothetical protein
VTFVESQSTTVSTSLDRNNDFKKFCAFSHNRKIGTATRSELIKELLCIDGVNKVGVCGSLLSGLIKELLCINVEIKQQSCTGVCGS